MREIPDETLIAAEDFLASYEPVDALLQAFYFGPNLVVDKASIESLITKHNIGVASNKSH